MDEIFGNGGEARFAAEDAARKDRIERDIGLTAILHGDSAVGSGDDKIGSGTESHEFAEKRWLGDGWLRSQFVSSRGGIQYGKNVQQWQATQNRSIDQEMRFGTLTY
jgi:hypothetical protein